MYLRLCFRRSSVLTFARRVIRLPLPFCHWGFLPLGFLLFVCAACSNTVDPFDRESGPPFAVYGYLDTAMDTQTVRVEPVRPFAPFDTTRIEATLRDETAGETAIMHPEVATLADGSAALFYRTALPILTGHEYALQIVAREAGTTTVRVQVLPVRPASLGEEVRDSTGKALGIVLRLGGPDVAPTRMTLVYTVEASGVTMTVPVAYAAGRDGASGGYEYALQLARDRLAVLSALGRSPGDSLRLVTLEVEIRDDGPEWRGEAGQGIENGFGRFSTISRSSQVIVPPGALLLEMGFDS